MAAMESAETSPFMQEFLKQVGNQSFLQKFIELDSDHGLHKEETPPPVMDRPTNNIQ